MDFHAILTWRSMPGVHGESRRPEGAPGREGGPGMLRTVSGDKCPQRAGMRRRFPVRRLHLVDIENLAGNSLPSLSQVREALGLYTDCLAFGAMDQVEVASSHLTLL